MRILDTELTAIMDRHVEPKVGKLCFGSKEHSYQPDATKVYLATCAPTHITDWMCRYLEVKPGSRVLEPSAGIGGMRDVIRQYCPEVVSVELNRFNFHHLSKGDPNAINADFLRLSPDDCGKFSHVIMCPPKRSDDHIAHALKFLAPGGRLIALVQEKNVDRFSWWYKRIPDKFEFNGERITCGIVNVSA